MLYAQAPRHSEYGCAQRNICSSDLPVGPRKLSFTPEDIASLDDMVLAAFVNSVEHWIPTSVYLNTVGFAAAFAAGKSDNVQ